MIIFYFIYLDFTLFQAGIKSANYDEFVQSSILEGPSSNKKSSQPKCKENKKGKRNVKETLHIPTPPMSNKRNAKNSQRLRRSSSIPGGAAGGSYLLLRRISSHPSLLHSNKNKNQASKIFKFIYHLKKNISQKLDFLGFRPTVDRQ